MTKTLTAFLAVGALGLAACGGVDRAGTRDQFIEDIEAFGGTADGDCVDEVFKDYSDDDIKNLSEQVENAQTEQLALDLVDCTDLGG